MYCSVPWSVFHGVFDSYISQPHFREKFLYFFTNTKKEMCLTTDKSQPAVNETIVELQWILLKSDNNVVTVSNKEKKKIYIVTFGPFLV